MSQNRPNVLFIMTDQQRFDAMSSHGGLARTPNLDGLAAGGADFHRAFSQAPVCVPSRSSLFTGRYPHATRIRENNVRLAPTEVHLFKALKQAGYAIGYTGKNHLLPAEEFERNCDLADTQDRRKAEPGSERERYRAFKKERGALLGTRGSWASATFHDFPETVSDTYLSRASALRFLDERPKDRPFCLAVSFDAPHVPHVAPRRFEAMYPLDKIEIPEVKPGDVEAKAPRFAIKREAQGSLRATDEDKRRYLAVYAAMVSWIDENIGAILRRLDELGLREDTIVVFTSDHGDFGFHHGMCKKDLVLLDDLTRVPFIVSWPGRIRPRVVDGTFAELVDAMPTLLELCGVEAPFGCQGKSLVPLLDGRTESHKDAAFSEACPPHYRNPYATHDEFIADWNANHETRGHPLCWTASYNVPGDFNKSIRTERWRYTWYGSGFEELYDHAADPREQTNLASRPEHAATCRELRLRLHEWESLTEDPLDPLHIGRNSEAYAAWR